jgi:hypothetical protein
MRRYAGRGRTSAGLLAAALVLTGCSVAVPDPAPDPSAAPICGALMADLPTTVLDQSRRKVQPGVRSAAWGKSTIVLRCGVPKPAALTNASECIEVNGVGWFQEPAQGGVLFTTIGRSAFVELAVPTAYAPETNALVDVAATVAAHDPVRTPCA